MGTPNHAGSNLSDELVPPPPPGSLGSWPSWGRWQWPSTMAVSAPGWPLARGSCLAIGRLDCELRRGRGRRRSADSTRRLHGPARWEREGRTVHKHPVWQWFKVLSKVLRAVALRSTAKCRVDPALSLVHPRPVKLFWLGNDDRIIPEDTNLFKKCRLTSKWTTVWLWRYIACSC